MNKHEVMITYHDSPIYEPHLNDRGDRVHYCGQVIRVGGVAVGRTDYLGSAWLACKTYIPHKQNCSY